MSAKDYISDLFKLLAEGKISEFTRRGNEALQEIEGDIANLREQAELIRKAVQRLGITANSKVRPTGTPLSKQQKDAIKEAAIRLSTLNNEVGVDDVLNDLKSRGVKLGVAKPTAVIGSILTRTKGFSRLDGGKYRYEEVK